MHPIDSLRQNMSDCGLPCSDEIILDGEIHRYSSQGQRSDVPEWYVGFVLPSGNIYCTFASWRMGNEKFTFRSNESAITDEEIQYISKKNEEIEDAWTKKHADAAKIAARRFSACDPATPSHPYLKRKQIKPHGIKQKDDFLYIPLCDLKGNIHSLQKISSTGEKTFLPEGKAKGHFFVLGNLEKSGRIYIAEGLATASSIYEATECATVIAFSCHNLLRVGHEIASAFPFKRVVLAADLGKAGDESLAKWKEIINEFAYQPNFYGKGKESDKDFNDLACHPELGKAEVKKQLSPAPPVISMIDFIKKDVPKLEWCVDNLFPKGSINMTYGDGGIGKSYFILDMAICAALSRKFMKFKGNGSRVLIIDGEMSERGLHERFVAALKRYAEIQTFSEIPIDLITTKLLRIKEEPEIDLYSDECRERLSRIFEKYDLIIFDNLSCLCVPGEEDYRNEDKIGSWIPIRRWLNPYKDGQKTFVFLHHSGKSGSARGTSARRGDMDTILHFTKCTKAFPTPVDLAFDFHFEKARDIPFSDQASMHISFSKERAEREKGKIQKDQSTKAWYGWSWEIIQQSSN